MQISPPNDDSRLQALNRKGEPTPVSSPVEQPQAPAPVRPPDTQREFQVRGRDRRKGQRRNRKAEVILDTRERRERRQQDRRAVDRKEKQEKGAPHSRRGIDVFT